MPDQEDINEELHPDYQKGFNNGYTIAEHMPELAAKLANLKGKSLQLEGLKHGIEQFDLDKNKDHFPDWLKSDRLSSLDKDADQTKDKNKDIPEKE